MNTWNKRRRIKSAGPYQKKESVLSPRRTKISSLQAGEGAVVEGTVISVSPLIIEEEHARIEAIPMQETDYLFQPGDKIRAVGFTVKKKQKLCLKASEITRME